MNKNNQINPVESGMEYLENIEDLGLKLDNIRFESIIDISKSKKEDIKVYDLEIEDNHNYQVDGLGIVHNGGGKRKGSFAMYIEPWHADIMDFLDLRKNHGKEEMRARDLFYAMWMNDLFMQRVQKDQIWSLMCPNECRGLTEAYAEDFTRLYESYESQGKFRKQIKARDLWSAICTAQIETGTPYMLYKDSINVKSNQKNLGTIKSSNLCLTGDTSITVKDVNGNVSDINLIDVIERVKSGEVLETLSKNIDTDLSEFKKILNAALTNDSASLIKITDTTSGKSIECTYEHKIYTKNRGYVEAQFLEESDVLDIIQ